MKEIENTSINIINDEVSAEDTLEKRIISTLEAEKKERADAASAAKALKDVETPPLKVYFTDIVEYVGLFGRKTMDSLKKEPIIQDFFKKETDRERWNFLMGLLNANARKWEYPEDQKELPPLEIRNSGDLETVKRYYAQNMNDMGIVARAMLLKRVHVLEKVERLQRIGEKEPLSPENLGADAVKGEVRKENKKGNTYIVKTLKRPQSSNNGCWSCGIEMMLKSHGIDVVQEDIRAFRPDYKKEFMATSEFREKVDAEYIHDDPKGIMDMADAALAFAPNKMVRSFEISPPGFAQQYVGIERKIDQETYIAASAATAGKKIRQILNEDKCTVSFTNGAHYFTITKIDGEKITCIDSLTKNKEVKELKDVIRDLYTGKYTKYGPASLQLVWMSDIELAADGKSFYNVPSHYLSLKEDGSLLLPPEHIRKDSDNEKTLFEQNGFRVKLVGGIDDTAYDRIKRNPLDENDLHITEQAYFPKKVNPEALKKRAAERTPKQTEELEKRRSALLGSSFKPAVHTLSAKEMDDAVREHEKISSKAGTVIHFEEANGLFDLKEEQKKDAQGREYLYYKPGAIVAYRINRSYEGVKTYLNYMIQFNGDEKYSRKLDEINKNYAEFMKKVDDPANAITDEVKPEIYPYKGYLKSEKDITEGVLFLASLGDMIDLKDDHRSARYMVTARNKYNPTVLARYGENIKELANPMAHTNLLKVCDEDREFKEAVDSLTADPGLVKKTADLKYRSYKTPAAVTDFIGMSIRICDRVVKGEQNDIKKEIKPLRFDPEVAGEIEEKRSEKRLNQYRSFLEEVSSGDYDFKPGVILELGKLLDDMEPFLKNGKTALLSYDGMNRLMKRYVKLQKEMESGEGKEYREYPAYRKFRQVMSKDIRMMYQTLKENKDLSDEEKKTLRFSLVDIFEKSRAVTVKVDEKTVQKVGGAQSSRLHIKAEETDGKKVDGYFTIHEEPFDFEASFDRFTDQIAKIVG